jgi:hypothetical protein
MMKNFAFDQNIESYLRGEMSISAFLELIPQKTFCFTDKIIKLLERSYIEKDPDKVEFLTIAASADGISKKYSEVFCKLLKENWHKKHEDIVMLLEEIRDPNTVDCISALVYRKMPWDDDEHYSLGLKCIWALGAIRNNKAVERLEELTTSNVEFIKSAATKQLQHIHKA